MFRLSVVQGPLILKQCLSCNMSQGIVDSKHLSCTNFISFLKGYKYLNSSSTINKKYTHQCNQYTREIYRSPVGKPDKKKSEFTLANLVDIYKNVFLCGKKITLISFCYIY